MRNEQERECVHEVIHTVIFPLPCPQSTAYLRMAKYAIRYPNGVAVFKWNKNAGQNIIGYAGAC